LLAALPRGDLSQTECTFLLLRLLGLHRPIEQGLAAHGACSTLGWSVAGPGASCSERLRDDLLRLGVAAATIAAAPEAGALLPALDDPPSALGCAWVVEGSAVGRQAMARPGGGLSFLDGARQYGRWAACCAALDGCDARPEWWPAILAAATRTFAAFDTWLDARR
jgi:heme oxygenase